MDSLDATVPLIKRLQAVLAACVALLIGAPASADCTPSAIIAIPVTTVSSRPLIQVTLNGTRARLIADTGAGISTLSRAFAARLKLPAAPGPLEYVRGVGGKATAQLITVEHVALADWSLQGVRFLVSRTFPAKLSGVLGQNVLQQADVDYDLGHNLIRIIPFTACPRPQLPDWARRGRAVSELSIHHPAAQAPLIVAAAYLNGDELRVLFDTGAPHSMLTAAGARRVGVHVDSNWSNASVLLTGVGDSAAIGSIRYFSTFKLGDERQRHIPLYVTDIEVPQIDMVLGMDFFLTHRVYVEASRGLLYFAR